MNARPVVLAAFALVVTGGLTGCGSSGKLGTGVAGTGQPTSALQSELLHPHRYALKQVKGAFSAQGIRLRRMRTRYDRHVVVLFNPRWHAPTSFHLDGGPPARTYYWVFVHAKARAWVYVQDGNVYVANGQGEGRSVDAALHKLDLSYKH